MVMNNIDNTTLDELANELNESIFENFADGLYIGMMSGTSLDGLDAVLCRFADDGSLEILATHHALFPTQLHSILLALCQPNGVLSQQDWMAEMGFASELDVYGWASVAYAEFTSEVVHHLLTQSNFQPDEIAAIGCHGQTLRHRPQWRFSLQLLDPNVLAERTGIAVVSDFRRRDMAVGGQGAPLVPAFHQALFGQTEKNDNTLNDTITVVLNLGGIANITLLMADDNKESKQVLGFDTGPANLLLDAWCLRHTAQPFDKNGDWARSGTVVEPVLQQLQQHEFFSLPTPKSTGREAFHLDWLDNELAVVERQFPDLHYSPADIQATLTELTAITVTKGIEQALNHHDKELDSVKTAQLLVCGGGAYNQFLLERLQSHLTNWHISTTETAGLSPTWVEAAAFAWLARQTMMSEPSNLPAVTGADKAVVLGVVCF